MHSNEIDTYDSSNIYNAAALNQSSWRAFLSTMSNTIKERTSSTSSIQSYENITTNNNNNNNNNNHNNNNNINNDINDEKLDDGSICSCLCKSKVCECNCQCVTHTLSRMQIRARQRLKNIQDEHRKLLDAAQNVENESADIRKQTEEILKKQNEERNNKSQSNKTNVNRHINYSLPWLKNKRAPGDPALQRIWKQRVDKKIITSASEFPLNALSDDLIYKIFNYLSAKDLLNCQIVCIKFHQLATEASCALYQDTFGSFPQYFQKALSKVASPKVVNKRKKRKSMVTPSSPLLDPKQRKHRANTMRIVHLVQNTHSSKIDNNLNIENVDILQRLELLWLSAYRGYIAYIVDLLLPKFNIDDIDEYELINYERINLNIDPHSIPQWVYFNINKTRKHIRKWFDKAEDGIDTLNKVGNSALHDACRHNDILMTRLLILAGADPYKISTKFNGDCFHITALHGHLKIMKFLFEKFPDTSIDHIDTKEATILYYAARSGHSELVSYLMLSNADPFRMTSSSKHSVYAASANGHAHVVEELLKTLSMEKQIELVNSPCESGKTSLYAATEAGHADVVKVLLDAKADVHLETFRQKTALYPAAEATNVEIVKLLLKHISHRDIFRMTVYGTTPMYIASKQSNQEVKRIFLCTLLKAKWPKTMREYVEKSAIEEEMKKVDDFNIDQFDFNNTRLGQLYEENDFVLPTSILKLSPPVFIEELGAFYRAARQIYGIEKPQKTVEPPSESLTRQRKVASPPPLFVPKKRSKRLKHLSSRRNEMLSKSYENVTNNDISINDEKEDDLIEGEEQNKTHHHHHKKHRKMDYHSAPHYRQQHHTYETNREAVSLPKITGAFAPESQSDTKLNASTKKSPYENAWRSSRRMEESKSSARAILNRKHHSQTPPQRRRTLPVKLDSSFLQPTKSSAARVIKRAKSVYKTFTKSDVRYHKKLEPISPVLKDLPLSHMNDDDNNNNNNNYTNSSPYALPIRTTNRKHRSSRFPNPV